MTTLLRMLHITLWMLPLQRALLLVGIALALAGVISGRWQATASLLLALLLPLLTSGLFLRKLASPRHAHLWPHARLRLLLGAVGTLVLVSLVYVVAFALDFVRAPPRYKPDAEAYFMFYALMFVLWSQCTLSLFVASRSPAWALAVLGLWLLPGVALRLLGIDDVPRRLAGPTGMLIACLAWIGFGIWFVQARTIGDAAWRMRAGGVTGTTLPDAEPATRAVAMQRWLLNAGTPLGFGVQWGLSALLLVTVQLLAPKLIGGDAPSRWVNAMIFGTLSLSAAVIGAISWTLAKRSRWLWLTAGLSRLELFAWCERLLLKVVLAITLPLVAIGGLLWLLVDARPATPPAYLLLALLAPCLCAAWFGLMQVHRRVALDGVAAMLVVAGWYFGLIQPLFHDVAQPRWEFVFAQFAFVVLLREVAHVRWRSADWPRAQPAPAFD